MVTLLVEKECGCFKKSDFQPKQFFEDKQVALKEARDMCGKMNEKFCLKHKFSIESNGGEVLIKMEVRK